MGTADFVNNIPVVGWVIFLIFGIIALIVVLSVVIIATMILLKKNIKTKFFEISGAMAVRPETKELYIAEGKDQIENQSQVAKQLLKSIRIKLYETAMTVFDFKQAQDRAIFELITYRIVDRLNYEVKSDLTRNHITQKSNYELKQYSYAKAKGYYRLIQEKLYLLNEKLPKFNLPDIMEKISIDEMKELFEDIYFSARSIAGGDKNE